jgi:hypothetical protein
MLHLAVGKSESKYTPANLIQLVVAKLNCAGRELLLDARRKFQRCYRFQIAHDLPLVLLPLNYRSASRAGAWPIASAMRGIYPSLSEKAVIAITF